MFAIVFIVTAIAGELETTLGFFSSLFHVLLLIP